jgi:CHAT domain-containing protein/Tfp pilus assembly protein PilF
MIRCRNATSFLLLLLPLIAAPSLAATQAAHAAETGMHGVVLLAVAPDSALGRAGLAAGDAIFAWELERSATQDARLPEHGEVASAFDWSWLMVELAPRGRLTLTGEHQGQGARWVVGPGAWQAQVRPSMRASIWSTVAQGDELAGRRDYDGAAALWTATVRSSAADGIPGLGCWLHLKLAQLWSRAARWHSAELEYGAALDAAGRDPRARVEVLRVTADSYRHGWQPPRLDEARRAYEEALRVAVSEWGEGFLAARALGDLGRLAQEQAELGRAEEHRRQALAIVERLTPRSIEVGRRLADLGATLTSMDRFGEAETVAQRALSIFEQLGAPTERAPALNSLGRLAYRQGHPAKAEVYYRQALAGTPPATEDGETAKALLGLAMVGILRGDHAEALGDLDRALAIEERLEPGSPDHIGVINRLALLASNRGDQQAAQSYAARSLEMAERLQPDGLDLASVLHILGDLASDREDFATAEDYQLRAIAIEERRAPESFRLALGLDGYGIVAMRQGKLHLARRYCARALRMARQVAPNGLLVAAVLENMGDLSREEGHLERAQRFYEQALASYQVVAPGGRTTAALITCIGDLELSRGLYRAARRDLERGLHILEARGFDTEEMVHTLEGLAKVEAHLRPERAAGYFERAIAVFEGQASRLGGAQERSAQFRAGSDWIYRDYVAFLLARRQQALAFATLERARGRALLAEIAERDMAFHRDVPQPLAESRRRIASEYDLTQQQLERLGDGSDPARAEDLRRQLRALRRQHDDIDDQIRQASPRLATLRYPRPLDLGGVQGELDEGTAMLAYSVGVTRTYLFAVTRTGLAVKTVRLGEAALQRQVAGLRRLIAEARPNGSAIGRFRGRELERLAKVLYKVLIAPAEVQVAGSRRLLILPDGPLHVLPWAALIRDPGAVGAAAPALGGGSAARSRRWRYLAEWKPLHLALSATIYAELKRGRHPRASPGGGPLVAFGDPHLPAWLKDSDPTRIADPEVRSAVTRGLALEPLPATRREVEGIARLYPEDSRVYLGEEATEERAKTLGQEVRYIHFATHSLIDERVPLDSAVVLSMPEQLDGRHDNGLLQAWEIFDSVRLDADLVVLSSCESGLGKELAGEGLIGLTRAFHYAGARSVMASLWPVSDRMTGELMERFYRRLRAGQTKDEALQGAQRELIEHPVTVREDGGQLVALDGSAPYYWATFEISGDWR